MAQRKTIKSLETHTILPHTPTRYEIALWKGDPYTPTDIYRFGYTQRTTRRCLIEIFQANGATILEATKMSEDFEFGLKPNRFVLNDGWIFGKTGRTERECQNGT